MAKLNDQARKLVKLTKMVSDAQIVRLAEVNAELSALQAKSRALDDALSGRASEIRLVKADQADPALQSGADSQWQEWVALRRTELQSRSASVAARREAELRKAQLALGRVQAMEAVIARLDASKKPPTV